MATATKTIIDGLEELLGRVDSIQTSVDSSLNIPVSQTLLNRLNEIGNIVQQITVAKTLLIKETQITGLLNAFVTLLRDTAIEFSNNKNKNILSTEQHNFLHQLTLTSIGIQSYLQLIVRANVINNAYDKLSSFALLQPTNIKEIETIVQAQKSSSADEFMRTIQKTTKTTFNNIVNLDNEIANIKRIIQLRSLSEHANYSFIMLTGPPGTGKTILARSIANFHSDGKYFDLSMSALLGKYIGETEKNLTQLFEYVGKNSQTKYTIIIDELDDFLSEEAGKTAYLNTLRNTFQVALDPDNLGSNVVIVGMTNFYNKLNDVIKRRVSNTIYIGLPTLNDSLNYLFQQIDSTFQSFLFREKISPMTSLSDKYKMEVLTVFGNFSNYRFSNANMKNIAIAAEALAFSSTTINAFSYTPSNTTLVICVQDQMFLNIQSKSYGSTTLEEVSRWISDTPSSFSPYVHIIPSPENLRAAILQTNLITLENEQKFMSDNATTK